MENELPTVSIVIATYNSMRTLEECLESIIEQNYPRDKLEIIIADGGSTDETIATARKYGVDKILSNPLITGEAGKSVGVSAAKNEIIALIDSDNVLESKDWFRKMVEPFKDPEIVGSEPLYFTYRKGDSLINRYCALLGMSDPLVLYLGNYDRYSHLTGKWNGMNISSHNANGYLVLELDRQNIPTIGANGFLIRRKNLLQTTYKPYLFDIDVVYELVKGGENKFAKIKIGIIHLYADTTSSFARKQWRRVRDYLYFKKAKMRSYPWQNTNIKGLVKFTVVTVLVFPTVFSAFKGYARVRDPAWFFHPIACWLTLFIYGFAVISGRLFGVRLTR
jgi:glycosyltransferase involved in cell wall biosynthesis